MNVSNLVNFGTSSDLMDMMSASPSSRDYTTSARYINLEAASHPSVESARLEYLGRRSESLA